jgi:hypothetical protein
VVKNKEGFRGIARCLTLKPRAYIFNKQKVRFSNRSQICDILPILPPLTETIELQISKTQNPTSIKNGVLVVSS